MSFDPAKLPNVMHRIGPRSSPLWEGPQSASDMGGITFSMLSKYLVDKERFRVEYMLGLKNPDRFNHRMEYGNLWHLAEEHWANRSNGGNWQKAITTYSQQLCAKYRNQQYEVSKWYNVCKTQFPLYVEHWSKRPELVKKVTLLPEQVFSVRYFLADPSGPVYLRGKWDLVDLVTEGEDKGIWLQENKSKGEVDRLQIERQLTFDLQTMLYLSALHEEIQRKQNQQHSRNVWNHVLRGIRYNVIRRPLSGGKGNIVQGSGTKGSKCPKCKGEGRYIPSTRGMKCTRDYVPDSKLCEKCEGKGRIGAKPPETDQEYYGRLAEYIKAEPDSYFLRWNVGINFNDIQRFQSRCLNPILLNLCDDYQWWKWCQNTSEDPFNYDLRQCTFRDHTSRHYQMPYGVTSPLLDGGETDLDQYLATGNFVGLVQNDKLFTELQ